MSVCQNGRRFVACLRRASGVRRQTTNELESHVVSLQEPQSCCPDAAKRRNQGATVTIYVPLRNNVYTLLNNLVNARVRHAYGKMQLYFAVATVPSRRYASVDFSGTV